MGLLLFDLPKSLLHWIAEVALCLSELLCLFPRTGLGRHGLVLSVLTSVERLATVAIAAVLVVLGMPLPAIARMSNDHTDSDGGWLRAAGHVHSIRSPAVFLQNRFMCS
jgi:hypothetical protein